MATRAASRKGTVSPSFFAKRLFGQAAGILLLGSSVLLALSLFSFSLMDPSFNHVSDAPAQNLMGTGGAYISDVLLQTVGFASALVVLSMIGWGWRMVSKEFTRGWWVRVTALMIGLISFSAVLHFIPAPNNWPITSGLGGAIGLVVANVLSPLITGVGVAAMMVLLSIVTIPFAISLRRKEWLAIWLSITLMAGKAAHGLRLIKAAMKGSGEELEVKAEPRRRHVRLTKDETAEAVAEKPAREARKPKKQIEKKEKAAPAQQTAMDLKMRNGDFELPSVELLAKGKASKKKALSENALSQNAELLESVLADFGIKGEITRVSPGPVVTLYELEPSPGTKSSRVIGLADDIARSMSAISARIAVIPGRNAIGIELPNATREMVMLRELFESETYNDTKAKLPLVLGKDIGGDPIIADLARMPHLLVAGTTGSGKSVAINTMIMSLVYHMTPEECKFIMIDPKMLELSVYDGIPHLLSPVVTEPGKAVVALKWTVKEMENRYRLMSNLGVRNIDSYNKRIVEAARKGEELFRTVQTGFDPETGKPIYEKQPLEMTKLPMIVVVVDEMADLMLVAGKDIEGSIQRLAQMARAAGIHIIMATQRPSVDVITGIIKANFPTRISFQVTSKIDSRTILGEQGAEQLLGQGDMLYMAGGGRTTRVHGPFIDDKEVEQIVNFLKTQGEPVYDEMITAEEEQFDATGMGAANDDSEDGLYQQAVQIVLRDKKASTSYIQRKLKIGYNRAARLVERMEEEGIISGPNHVGKREILLTGS